MVFQNEQNLGLPKKQMGCSRKILKLLKIAKGGKLAVECESNDNISSIIHIRLNCDVFSATKEIRKVFNLEKLDNTMTKDNILKKKMLSFV